MTLRRFSEFALSAGFVLYSILPLHADMVSFSLLPSDGNVSGPAGSVVGWGYSLTNESASDWFMATDLNADAFSNGIPTVLFDFPILAPGQTVTEAFNSINSIGLYELAWNVSAPAGYVNSGNFVLSGQWWNGDPLSSGNFIAAAPDISLSYSATVSVSSVPEPSSFSLLLMAMFGTMGYWLARNRLRSSTRTEGIPKNEL